MSSVPRERENQAQLSARSGEASARPEGAQAHTEEPANFTEGSKLLHDTFKNITTLSTGSILLLVTFVDRLFDHPQGKALLGLAMVGFIIAMMSATGLMIIIGDQLRGREFYMRLPHTIRTRAFFNEFFLAELRLGAVLVAICVPSFIVGVGSLILFALINFYAA